MRIGFQSGNENTLKKSPESSTGLFGDAQGKLILPDLPTAVLATLRGYKMGTYPKPLEGIAKELGYHPLSSATPEEMAKIRDMIEGLETSWKES
jgi:hypothetical protein